MLRRQIVIVLGYGCHVNNVYQAYLQRVVNYISENPVKCVVLCGGFSQLSTAPNRSEAQTMESFLKPIIPWRIEIRRDDDSLTTYENIDNASDLIADFNGREYSVTIFCGAIWALKVKILAERIFPDYEIQIETYDISSRGEANRQLLSTILEVAGLYLPFLTYLHRRGREKRAKRI